MHAYSHHIYILYPLDCALSARTADSQEILVKATEAGRVTINLPADHPALNVTWVDSHKINDYLPQPVSCFKGNMSSGNAANFSHFLGVVSLQDPPRLTQTPSYHTPDGTSVR